jgi:hypothetical protein
VPGDVAEFFASAVAQGSSESAKKSPNLEAPMTVTIADEEYMLEKDEDMQVAESFAPGDEVILRSVSTKDMILGVERYTQHTEVSCVIREMVLC